MLCCVIGGFLVAAVARGVARHPNRRHSLVGVVVLGAAAGVLVVEISLATLALVGMADAPGSLLVRLTVLLAAGGAAAMAVGPGAAALLSARGSAFLGLSAGAAGLLAEGVDLHVVRLHDPHGALATLLIHLVPVGFFVAGLLRAARLAGVEQPACHCAGICRCGCQAVPGETAEDQPAPSALLTS